VKQVGALWPDDDRSALNWAGSASCSWVVSGIDEQDVGESIAQALTDNPLLFMRTLFLTIFQWNTTIHYESRSGEEINHHEQENTDVRVNA